MSGIVAILNLDHAPVSPSLLRRMTEYMAFRGPDAREVWIDGQVGFGHAMLRTTDESMHERQPCSLDGQVWITADARVDGRQDLIVKLEAAGRRDLKNATDVELILHSYHAWGDKCVDHLIGDFSFVIWDGLNRRLFCARDHFGVKPFFFAQVNNCLIISNTLDCIRLHPVVSDQLNEQAIGDFLLVGSNEEPTTTFFEAIKRLPAAHRLVFSMGNFKIDRYWVMPIEDEVHFKRESDYVERFVELLDQAVSDRLRTDRVGIFMSGGLDSSTVAATAHKLLSKQSANFDMQAFTIVFDRLIHDDERYYSGVVAEGLKIPITFLPADEYKLYQGYPTDFPDSEPTQGPLRIIGDDRHRMAAAYSRVVLTGEGGDVFLRPSASYLVGLVKNLQFGHLLKDLVRHIRRNRRFPRIGIRTALRSRFRARRSDIPEIEWLNPIFESTYKLKSRWIELNKFPKSAHPTRPDAYEHLTTPRWASFFESYDAGVMHLPVEVRHPLFDIRLLKYTLRLPSMPWCIDKELIRISMKGLLPDEILKRNKTPVSESPVLAIMRSGKFQIADNFLSLPDLGSFINKNRLLEFGEKFLANHHTSVNTAQIWIFFRVINLGYWLEALQSSETAAEELCQ